MCGLSSFPPILPTAQTSESLQKTNLLDWPGPFLFATRGGTRFLPAIGGNESPAGTAHHAVSPHASRAILCPAAVPTTFLPLSLPAPLITLLCCVAGMTSFPCSSSAGRTQRCSNCPKPHSFNPNKEQTHERPTIKRQLRLSLKKLPEAAPGTQPFHQLRVERAQT